MNEECESVRGAREHGLRGEETELLHHAAPGAPLGLNDVPYLAQVG